MKAGREHRVPLSAAALAILKGMKETRESDFVRSPSYPRQSVAAPGRVARNAANSSSPESVRACPHPQPSAKRGELGQGRSLNLANIDVNDGYFGSVANGSAFYRDVPAGHYHIAPVSYNRDLNQDRDVDLVSGQQLYVKILSSQSWDGACRDCVRDTFYAWLIPAQVAQGEIARARGSI
jgi:hypothetical protein